MLHNSSIFNIHRARSLRVNPPVSTSLDEKFAIASHSHAAVAAAALRKSGTQSSNLSAAQSPDEISKVQLQQRHISI
jgi:hypothetical protein